MPQTKPNQTVATLKWRLLRNAKGNGSRWIASFLSPVVPADYYAAQKKFNAITHLKILLGLPYNKGCNVSANIEDAWERYVNVWLK